jgi:hypothetical protein
VTKTREQLKPANNAPLYACFYRGFAEIARDHGYALAVHGSLARDLDLIAIPWVEDAKPIEDVLAAITSKYAVRMIEGHSGPEMKPHGRIAYSLHCEFGNVYFDISFMPRVWP